MELDQTLPRLNQPIRAQDFDSAAQIGTQAHVSAAVYLEALGHIERIEGTRVSAETFGDHISFTPLKSISIVSWKNVPIFAFRINTEPHKPGIEFLN